MLRLLEKELRRNWDVKRELVRLGFNREIDQRLLEGNMW